MKKSPTVIEARDLVANAPDEEERQVTTLAMRMRALGDAVRLRIIKIIVHTEARIIEAARLVTLLGIDQSCVNRHLHVLERAGFLRLVMEKRQYTGRSHYYEVDHEAIHQALDGALSYTGLT